MYNDEDFLIRVIGYDTDVAIQDDEQWIEDNYWDDMMNCLDF